MIIHSFRKEMQETLMNKYKEELLLNVQENKNSPEHYYVNYVSKNELLGYKN